MTDLKAFGWYLENTQPGHSKFYRVIIVETGVTILNWGKIGATGQGKIVQLPFIEADSTGKRQVYEKAAKGYEFVTNGMKFLIDSQLVARVVQRSNDGVSDAWQEVLPVFRSAQQFGGDLVAVLEHYDDLQAQAERLVQRAADGERSDVLLDEWGRLRAAWDQIEDRHGLAKVNVEFAGEMLRQALMS